jgi:PPM family protein phosphatase
MFRDKSRHAVASRRSAEARFAPFGAALVAPWSVVACSDGVWKFAGWERVLEAVRVERGQQLLERLQSFVRASNSGKFHDDFTVVLFEGTAESL